MSAQMNAAAKVSLLPGLTRWRNARHVLHGVMSLDALVFRTAVEIA
jgi:hypothetical protein